MKTPLKVLLVEDSASDEKLLVHELRRGGFIATCRRVENAKSMVDELETQQWDIVISDYRLPQFSGTEALEILKQSSIDIPFILLSGTIGEVNAVDAMLAGANDYVMKDNMARLIPAIRRELADAAARANHRDAEAELLESEERFRNVADSAPVLLWMSDANGNLTYVNRQWLIFTGTRPGQEVRHSRTDHVHPDDLTAIRTALAVADMQKKSFQIEYRMRRGDGQWRWLLDTGLPRFRNDGVFSGFIGTCLDLTDRKQAEMDHRHVLDENYRLLQANEEIAVQQREFVRDILYSVTDGKLRVCDKSASLPESLNPASEAVELSATTGLRDLRHAAADAMQILGFPAERYHDMITAVGEAGMNAVVHAGGGKGRIYSDGSDTVQVWISDQGRGINVKALPRATLERGYTTAGSLGQGMKMMIAMVDRIWLLTQPTGTTVVIEQDRIAPVPTSTWGGV